MNEVNTNDMNYETIPGLVSVMIPTYNRPCLFEKTLQSALDQTYRHVEVIVCDNSTDEYTATIAEKYRSSCRLRYYRNRDAKTKEENFSPFYYLARGEYLQWVMDDDILHPQKLEKMVMALELCPQVTLVSSFRGFIDINGDSCGQQNSDKIADRALYRNNEFLYFSGKELGSIFLEFSNYVGEPSAVLFRRRDLPQNYWHAEYDGYLVISDVAMWLALLEKGDSIMFLSPLSYFRKHKEQEGQKHDAIILSRTEWIRLTIDYHKRRIFPYKEKVFRKVLQNFIYEYEIAYSKQLPSISTKIYHQYRSAINQARNILTMNP